MKINKNQTEVAPRLKKIPSESALRRKAQRQGLILRKARTRNQEHPDHGTYCLICASTNFLELGDNNTGFGYSLDEINHYLAEPVQPSA
jgi:hypothetical protein